jgi:high-affinity iron transporter
MLATAIVVFREVLEAALIIAIVLGASRDIENRSRWIWAGTLAGLGTAAGVAFLAMQAGELFQENGQAILNASVLLVAVLMLTWHNVWMAAHSREMQAQIQQAGKAVHAGEQHLAALGIVTFVAVMREGSEAVLFLWAIVAGGGETGEMVSGGALGVATGALCGWLLYKGLLKISVRHFFSTTRWILLLLASGLSAQAAGFLNQAGILPSLGNNLWNTSWLLEQTSLLGQLLHILVGYIARPSGIQLLFYSITLTTILLLMKRAQATPQKAK